MKKIAAVILLALITCTSIFFGGSDSSTLSSDVTDIVTTSNAPSSVKLLARFYKKGLIREKLGAYENALFSYSSCNSKAIELLNSKRITKKEINQILPYAIASAYRKGILTHRTIEGSVMKLYKQLELYKDTNISIDEVLTAISNISTEKGMNISPQQYYPLYYARAYNRFGWAYALLNGSAWKRYIIYTPADTITMVDKSIEDINFALSSFDIDYSNALSEWFAGNSVDNVLNKRLIYNSPEHLTFALCFNNYDLKSIRHIVKKQLLNQLRKTVEFYNKRETKRILNRGKRIFAYEDFMKPGTKELISTMAQFLELMK